MSEAAPSDRAPTVEVEAFGEYVLGLPMPVSITLKNHTDDTGMGAIPRLTPWRADAPVELEWTDARGRRTTVKAPWSRQEEPRGPTLSPGESLRMPYDLSLLHRQPAPGAYTLRVRLRYYDEVSVSAPVTVRIAAAAKEIAPARALLAPLGERSWAAFVLENRREVPPPPRLSERTTKLLALHLFLQRAANGPEPIGELDLRPLDPARHGPTEAEAELCRLEVLRARKDPSADALAARIAARWPGMRPAVARADRGEGPISSLREIVGR